MCPDGAVAKSSASGFGRYWVHISVSAPIHSVFLKVSGPVGRCKATTPSSFSLTSNRVTTNLLTYCPRQTAQLITGVCAHDRRAL